MAYFEKLTHPLQGPPEWLWSSKTLIHTGGSLGNRTDRVVRRQQIRRHPIRSPKWPNTHLAFLDADFTIADGQQWELRYRVLRIASFIGEFSVDWPGAAGAVKG